MSIIDIEYMEDKELKFTDSSNDQLESALAGVLYGNQKNMEVDLFAVDDESKEEAAVSEFDELIDVTESAEYIEVTEDESLTDDIEV